MPLPILIKKKKKENLIENKKLDIIDKKAIDISD
jgi:hypothetical protein